MGDTEHKITGMISTENDVWSYTYTRTLICTPVHPDYFTDIFMDLFSADSACAKAKAMDHAISALHGQHTRNGRPLRYMPELE